MKKLILLFFVLFLFSGCLKVNLFPDSEYPYLDYMPEKTTVGNNTFGCYKNGK